MPNIYHAQARRVYPGQQHVFIAVPAGQPVDPALLNYLWETQASLAEMSIAADLYILSGHCHVDDARNICVWEFLKTECTDMVFVDSDTCATEDAIVRLVSVNRDVVAGLYPYKSDDGEFPVRLLDWDNPPKYEDDGTIEIEAAPTGSLRMKRHVLQHMHDVSRKYHTKETKKYGGGKIGLIFERVIDDAEDRRGGDYNFCHKWRALGGKIHTLPDIIFRHYGTKAYTGNFAVRVAKRRGVETPAFDAAVEGIKEGELVAPHIARLVADYGNPFAAMPDVIASAYWIALEADRDIIETGSGVSTLVLGIAAARAGVTVHSLEHDPSYFLRTRKLLDRYGIKNVRLHYAPLRDYADGLVWYAIPDALPRHFYMALCDGPQQMWGRSGLYKLLGDRLIDAKIVMDDAANEDELKALQEWAEPLGRDVHVMEGDRPFAVSGPSALSTAA